MMNVGTVAMALNVTPFSPVWDAAGDLCELRGQPSDYLAPPGWPGSPPMTYRQIAIAEALLIGKLVNLGGSQL